MLEGRLLAPCCWNQTLDQHDSPLAASLRREIRERLDRGEASVVIEDDLAARFGERIRAVPRGRDPRTAVPVMVVLGMAVSAVGLLWGARRWTCRRVTSPTVAAADPARPRDEYDDRLEEELRRGDDA